ncbi:MAG TPA: NUDIX domain-containing protein [bacterium]|nr:NUDIX domain-containing protein [bacterium]
MAAPFNQIPLLSAGLALFRRDPDGPRYLLLRAFKYWDFPKGLLEPGEDPLAGARREVREETGIATLEFPFGEIFCETEVYGQGKVARYYLAETSEEKVELKPGPELKRPEHHEHRWLDYESARRLLVPRVQRILDWAQERLSS